MTIHAPKHRPLSLLDFELLSLGAGEQKLWSSDEFEAVIVLIEGVCAVSAGGETREWRRHSVFDDAASAAFISPGTELTLRASEKTIIALCKARAKKVFKPAFISPEQVRNEWRGEDGFRRQVFDIVNTETKTERIAVGETVSGPGQWSSFPPHKHDTHEKTAAGAVAEAPLEEIYYFRVEPATGFGFQRLYAGDRSFDEAYVIKDGDVTRIPAGYHPVANMPGH
ncbi:MAG: 5-deoxy-glucuronate isomerase, partial [Patescibacteria group bacterium]|nr:5-deoxy-glucuronate isomerase [Patescibacteria group bacterium]